MNRPDARRTRVSCLALAACFLMCFLPFTGGEATETITVDFGTTLGAAGDPVAAGFRSMWSAPPGQMSGQSTPMDLVWPLKPTCVGAPAPAYLGGTASDTVWTGSDSLWTWAARSGAIVVAAVMQPVPYADESYPDFRNVWKDSSAYADSVGTMDLWTSTCKDWVHYLTDGRPTNVTVHYDIWNEPDVGWHPYPQFTDPVELFYRMWKAAVDTIRAYDPNAIITGPSFADGVEGTAPGEASYSGVQLEGFLSYCRAHGCAPDVIGWHHLGGNHSDYRAVDGATTLKKNLYGQIVYARQRVDAIFAGSDTTADTFQYEINEFLGQSSGGQPIPEWVTPGILVRDFALAERAKPLGLVLVGHSLWCDPCQPCYQPCKERGFYQSVGDMLSGLINPQCEPDSTWDGRSDSTSYWCGNPTAPHGCPDDGGCSICKTCGTPLGPRYAWWVQKAYADLDGDYVSLAPSGTSFDGLASRNLATPSAQVLLGRYQAPSGRDSVRVVLENLDAVPGLVLSDIVEVEVKRYPASWDSLWRGGVTEDEIRVDSMTKRYVVGLDNSLTLTLGSEAAFDTLDAVSIVLGPPAFLSRTAAQ